MDYTQLNKNRQLALVTNRILQEETRNFQMSVDLDVAKATGEDEANVERMSTAIAKSDTVLSTLGAKAAELKAAGAEAGAEVVQQGPPGRQQRGQ